MLKIDQNTFCILFEANLLYKNVVLQDVYFIIIELDANYVYSGPQ